MAAQREERRLAAILCADVVGYSRLMGADESGTLARLKTHREEIIDPRIAEHHGRIVKLMGDGVLVEFASVVDAVQCAADIQRAMAERNAAVAEERRIELRIGINLGDIIVDGDDIHGDGVNVAARLQEMAEPGGTCVSGAVFDAAKDKLDLGFEDLGPQALKNIAEPVRAYRVFPKSAAVVIEENWCGRDNWVQAASEHDAKVGAKAQDGIEARAVAKTVNLVEDATTVAHEAMEWVREALRTVTAKSPADIALMIEKAIELMQAVEVAKGGVSNRTAHGHLTADLREMLGSFGAEGEKVH